MKFTKENTAILKAIEIYGSNFSNELSRGIKKPRDESDPSFVAYFDFLFFGSNSSIYYYSKNVTDRAVEYLSNPAIISQLNTINDCGLILINKRYSVFFRLHEGVFTSTFFDGLRATKFGHVGLDAPNATRVVKEEIERTNTLNQFIPLPLLVLYHFAEVEIKIINKDRKKVKIGSEVVFNSNKVKIQVIDSSYFTNIIRTEGFAVRGHFAIRACGPGGKDRKITWIKPHEKNGYNRKARLESLSECGHPGFKGQNKFDKLSEEARNLGCICTPGSQSSSCPAIEKRACIHGEDFLEEMLEDY